MIEDGTLYVIRSGAHPFLQQLLGNRDHGAAALGNGPDLIRGRDAHWSRGVGFEAHAGRRGDHLAADPDVDRRVVCRLGSHYSSPIYLMMKRLLPGTVVVCLAITSLGTLASAITAL